MYTSDESSEEFTAEEVIVKIEQSISSGDEDLRDLETDVFICPPESNVLTDEDSGDDDEGEVINNMTRRQLAAPAEIRYTRMRAGGEDFDGYTATSNRSWIDGDFKHVSNSSEFSAEKYAKYSKLTPVDLFELFFDDEMIGHLLVETEKYAAFKHCPNPSIQLEEMKCFLGILILSGYNKLPGKKFYWDTKNDMHNKMVADSIRRDRFVQIMRFIHIADNTKMDPNDKLWKLRPVIHILKKNFLNNFVEHEFLNYGESMINYFGNYGSKQFIRLKPTGFRYKSWCLNTDYGYLIDFEIDQGKNPNCIKAHEDEFGKCAAPLISMLDKLEEKPYQIFIDDSVTGINLLNYLKNKGLSCTGTLRENRLPKDCPMSSIVEMKEAKRGTFENKIDREDGIIVCRWIDNSVVTIASTTHGVEPINQVKRYSSKEKKFITIPQPSIFHKYNKHMGGTDRMEENVSMYQIAIKGKKWWWPIFIWCIDVAMNNAWLLYVKSVKHITRLEFRRQVTQTYLTRYKTPAKSTGGLVSSGPIDKRVIPDLRYDGCDHLVVPNDNNKRRRCAGENCKSVVRTKCEKCNIGLCVLCFSEFHRK